MNRAIPMLLLLIGLASGNPVAAAPKADLWERWTAHDNVSEETIDHAVWTGFLQTYLQEDDSDVTRLDYGAVDSKDRERLDDYYAVNCASVGCPDLQPVAFTAENVEARLDRAADGYINDPRGFTVDDDGDLTVSSIYDWFQEDFGDSQAGVIEHLRQYADESRSSMLDDRKGYDSHRYDWSINDVK